MNTLRPTPSPTAAPLLRSTVAAIRERGGMASTIPVGVCG